MKNKIIIYVVVILFIVGLLFILYPTFNNLWNNYNQSKAISNHITQIENMTENEIKLAISEAIEYNRTIATRGISSALNEEEQKIYNDLLNVSNNSIMGYIEIPKIHVKLPIYHGTSDQVLQVAIGHVAGSSLPIGGDSTHSILMGHRGLPSAKLFTSLDKMALGDYFYIYALNDTLVYQVDDIKIIKPEELADIKIEAGQDYVTLVTCTPYGINSHRLLVRGHRVLNGTTDVKTYNNDQKIKICIIFFLIVILLIVVIVAIGYKGKKNSSKNLNKHTSHNKKMVRKATRKK